MTAEQKAKELVKKFHPFVYCYSGSGMLANESDDGVILQMSKGCARIAVEHSIESIKGMHLKNYANTVDFKATEAHSGEVRFLKEVLEEIEKVQIKNKK